MKIEIWSDIMCPFCYIGKRHFEAALAEFEGRDEVEITWKSFQLDPGMKTEAGKSINEYLAERKGWTLDYTRQVHRQVTDMAAKAGLLYDFDKAVVANSRDAHRLIQLAKSEGKGDLMEERLFKAYFTEGLNIADHATLTALGMDCGLDEKTVKETLAVNRFDAEVTADLREGEALGLRGVPFFVIDRKFGISGAQPPEAFLKTFRAAKEEAKHN